MITSKEEGFQEKIEHQIETCVALIKEELDAKRNESQAIIKERSPPRKKWRTILSQLLENRKPKQQRSEMETYRNFDVHLNSTDEKIKEYKRNTLLF